MRKLAEVVGWIVLGLVAFVLFDVILSEFRDDIIYIKQKSPFQHPPVGVWEKE